MKDTIYIVCSFGFDEQHNIEAFIDEEGAKSFKTSCEMYEKNTKYPQWDSDDKSFDEFGELLHIWIRDHPGKQMSPAGLGFKIEPIELNK